MGRYATNAVTPVCPAAAAKVACALNGASTPDALAEPASVIPNRSALRPFIAPSTSVGAAIPAVNDKPEIRSSHVPAALKSSATKCTLIASRATG
jgi:hypothetical protein